MSGISKFSASDLRKQLSGKQASVGLGADVNEHMITGRAALKDVETMFQLLYLNFTAPRFSEDDFQTLMNRYNAMLANQMTNPDFIFSQEMLKSLYGNNHRRQQLTPELLAGVKFEHMAQVHKQLFSNAADFRFTFVGNMSPEELKPLVEKYIGSLPTAKKPANVYTDDKVRTVKGGVENDFKVKMEQPKVSVFFGYSGDAEYTMKNIITAKYLSAALSNRYLKSIREEKGGTYGVSSRVSLAPRIKEYFVQIAFDTNEQMADELAAIIVAEIEKIAAEGPLAEDLNKAREFENKNFSKSMEQNNWWSTAIDDYYKYGINTVEEYLPAVNSVSAADVQALAKKILADGNIVKVVMRPEK
jgi:zinc protease